MLGWRAIVIDRDSCWHLLLYTVQHRAREQYWGRFSGSHKTCRRCRTTILNDLSGARRIGAAAGYYLMWRWPYRHCSLVCLEARPSSMFCRRSVVRQAQRTTAAFLLSSPSFGRLGVRQQIALPASSRLVAAGSGSSLLLPGQLGLSCRHCAVAFPCAANRNVHQQQA